MILLDTNVLSEMIKPEPDPNVEGWLVTQFASALFISSITEAELRYGVALLPAGQRRNKLFQAVTALLVEEFADRILPFDSSAAAEYAAIAAERRRSGRAISQFDAQIAAIARSRGAMLATRNISDFQGCGIDVLDPWQGRC